VQRIPRLLLIFDGMGDRPIVELGEKTPLQAANLPVMDQLALEGQCGVADPVRSGTVATTVMGTLAILGYDPLRFSIARGLIEAIGCGMKIMPGDVAFRGNWATLDEEGFGGILGDSAVASPNSPLKPGEGGASEFIPGEPGTYYYICTVPGHREMGMVGTIIVE